MKLQTRRHVVIVIKSSKIGWALVFHPDARFRHQFKELNGASKIWRFWEAWWTTGRSRVT